MYSIHIFQEVISTPYIVFTKAKACDWLVTRIRKEITSKIHKKISKVESEKTEQNSHHAWAVQILKVLCEFRTTQGVVRNFRTSLEQLASKGHIFLISAPNRARFEALDS